MDFETFHISNIGTLIEQNEDKLRSEVSQLYINKQRQITNTGRLLEHYMTKEEQQKFRAELEEAQNKEKAKGAAADAKDETFR